MSDPLMQMLADLPVAHSDGARADRVRAICRARLARQAQSSSRTHASRTSERTARAWRPAIVALGVIYLTEAIGLALRMYRAP